MWSPHLRGSPLPPVTRAGHSTPAQTTARRPLKEMTS